MNAWTRRTVEEVVRDGRMLATFLKIELAAFADGLNVG